MPSRPPTTFREQAEGAVAGLAGTVVCLLWQVARGTEVRTEGDRALVLVCTVGALVIGAAVLVLLAHGALRRRRARIVEGQGAGARFTAMASAEPGDADPAGDRRDGAP